jgi:hypothetical protein
MLLASRRLPLRVQNEKPLAMPGNLAQDALMEANVLGARIFRPEIIRLIEVMDHPFLPLSKSRGAAKCANPAHRPFHAEQKS